MSTNIQKIVDFYKNREVFITGGTGFVGKTLVEKLLRSCPGIGKIYLLIRRKKNQSLLDRFEALKASEAFSLLLKVSPNAFDKVIPIEGDVKELNLGISQFDLIRLSNVSIIFNASASVRFDDPLKDAIFVNVRSTRELLNIALGLKKLQAFVHISTAFCNCDYSTIEEKIYPKHADWKTMIQLAETMDSYTLDILAPKIMDNLVNTYLFTKGLAENICEEYSKSLPIAIYRPSIVTGAEKEPIPGWCDNLNGIIGLSVASGIGIIRLILCDADIELNCTPVDTCANGIVVAAWKKVLIDKRDDLPIYNCNNGTTSVREIGDLTKLFKYELAVPYCIWNPVQCLTSSVWYYKLNGVLFHFLPAILVDFILRNFSQTDFSLLKIQRKVTQAQIALLYFMTRTWTIKNENYMDLDKYIRPDELETFSIYSLEALTNRVKYIRNQIVCTRRYILKEPDETIPYSAKKMAIMTGLDYFFKGIFWFLVIYYGILCKFF